jgi:hypothetical protein
VSVTACQSSPSGGHPVAAGKIDNHSSDASTYALSVVFLDKSGNRVSEGGAAVAKVSAGSTATWRATGLTGAKGPLRCKLSSVTRTIAP